MLPGPTIIVNAVQQFYDALVAYAIIDFGAISATFQNTLVPHHIELLTGNRLFAPYSLCDGADTHLLLFKEFDNLEPDGVSYRLQNLCYMICYVTIHDDYPQLYSTILLYIDISICSEDIEKKNKKK